MKKTYLHMWKKNNYNDFLLVWDHKPAAWHKLSLYLAPPVDVNNYALFLKQNDVMTSSCLIKIIHSCSEMMNFSSHFQVNVKLSTLKEKFHISLCPIGLLQLSRGTKSAMMEGKLIIIPALGHQNKVKLHWFRFLCFNVPVQE